MYCKSFTPISPRGSPCTALFFLTIVAIGMARFEGSSNTQINGGNFGVMNSEHRGLNCVRRKPH